MQEQYNRFHGDYAIRKQLCPKAIDEYARLSQSQQLALRNEGEMPQEARMLRAWQNRSSNAAITMKERIKKKHKGANTQRSKSQRGERSQNQQAACAIKKQPRIGIKNMAMNPGIDREEGKVKNKAMNSSNELLRRKEKLERNVRTHEI